MKRTVAVLLAVMATAATAGLPAAAQETEIPHTPDHARAYMIMPPGQSGEITAAEFASGDYGPHFSDQLEPYAALIEDDDVTEPELSNYFHSMPFGPEEIEREYSPGEGVTVYRDTLGIPHVYGTDLTTLSFGLGYVTAEDRMFQMDVFRHAAEGRLAEFAGPGSDDAFVRRDIETRREGYTPDEVQAMYDSLDDKYGEKGEMLQAGLQAYADGINAYIDEIQLDPTKRPFEYDATGNTAPEHPREWTPVDTLFIVVLQLRVFGETAGGELEHAGFLAHLRDKHGRRAGTRLFNELLFQNDRRSPTTIPKGETNFATQDLGPVDWRAVAIPDQAEKVAERARAERIEREAWLLSLGFRKQASNALLVSGKKSSSGNPLLLGGPQVGHALPSFFLEIDAHAPGIDFRGPAVPGTSALLPLGRGSDYAWTLTTGYSDAVDVRAEKLCDPAGKEPTLESNAYVFKGECIEMESREETIQVEPTPTDPGAPREETVTIYRTKHGPVFDRAKVNGAPTAFVRQRFFWMKEVDSLPSFLDWNLNIDSLADFAKAAKGFTMSFNSFFADHENIGYFHVGEYPVRTPGVHPALPAWGTGRWEWNGRRSYKLQPKLVNPDQGWVANWNNKPSRGWDNQDGYKWGAVQRVSLLMERMKDLFEDGGKATPSDLVDVIRDAATRDARGAYLGPKMVKKAQRGADERTRTALEIVKNWITDGAHRLNRDRDDEMDAGAALAIFDAWYTKLVHRVFDDEVGENGYDMMGDAEIADYQPASGGGFWFDFSSYLDNLMRKDTRRRAFSRNLCDNLTTTDQREGCGKQVRAALADALAQLTEEQGQDMGAWTTPAENMTFTNNANSATAGSVPDIPWQNRGTENHLVEILSDAD